MFEQQLVGTLAMATLGIVLVIALFLFVRFMRKPQNRHPMDGERERNIGEIRHQAGVETEDQQQQTRRPIS